MADENHAHPPVVSRAEWRQQRVELLKAEKELTRHYDRVNAIRRRLPMVKLDKEYRFIGPTTTPEGSASLLDLFEGQQQLIIYHFMFDPEWTTGCDGCTGFVDALGNLSDLADRRTTFALISRAPLEKLAAYQQERGWAGIRWYSSLGSDFNYDFQATLDEEVAPPEYNYKTKAEWDAQLGRPWNYKGEHHGLSVFFRVGDAIHHTYSSHARGVESVTDLYQLLDRTPYGRQESFEDSPEGWPQRPTYGL